MTYLRTTIGRWRIDLQSEEGDTIFALIRDEGLAVFRAQPGFISYRLMRADDTTTIAVAEWQNRELGEAGAWKFRQWLESSGIAGRLKLETFDGDVVVSS